MTCVWLERVEEAVAAALMPAGESEQSGRRGPPESPLPQAARAG
jgi:hypothetical protein